MKKTINLILLIFIIFTILIGCKNNNVQQDDGKLSIITTVFPGYDFTRQIVGENANVTMLIKPGAETHSFDPTPQDIKKIQNADLFIYTGGENDVWIDDILYSMEGNIPETLKLMDCVDVIEEKLVEGMEDDEHTHHEDEEEHKHQDEEHEEVELDEHVWTSPKNAIKIVTKIDSILQKKDPENASIYAQNTANFISQLEELDKNLQQVIDTSSRKILVFGDRFPFGYLAKDYGLEYFAAFKGCSTETEASPATVSFLVDKVKQQNIPVVFTIEMSNGKIADSICDATNAKKLTLHSCHNLSANEFENGETYVSLMQKNIQNIREALN